MNVCLNKQQIQDIIHQYLTGMSSRNLAKRYNFRCHKSILRILKSNNIIIRPTKVDKQFNKKDIDKILLMNHDPQISVTDISRKLNVDYKTIKKQLIKHQVYQPNKYDDFLIDKFKIINTEEQAYWLGMLAADGNVSNKQLSLQLAEQDLSHVIKFKNFIGVNYKIMKRRAELNGKIFTGYRYSVSSKQFVESLKKHGLIPNKSCTLPFPTTINDKLIRHYIRGLVDGDGSFFIRHQLNFSLVSSIEVCDQVQQYLMKNCYVNKTKLYIKTSKKNEKYCYLKYCGSLQNIRIAKYLYQNSNIFLDRKKRLLNDFLISRNE